MVPNALLLVALSFALALTLALALQSLTSIPAQSTFGPLLRLLLRLMMMVKMTSLLFLLDVVRDKKKNLIRRHGTNIYI